MSKTLAILFHAGFHDESRVRRPGDTNAVQGVKPARPSDSGKTGKFDSTPVTGKVDTGSGYPRLRSATRPSIDSPFIVIVKRDLLDV